MQDPELSSELLSIYIEDARGHLEALDACLLALERGGPDPARAASVLGPLHTLKGNSGMMGFTAIKDYVHRLEDVFARLRDQGLALGPSSFDRLFAGASSLREAVEAAAAGGHEQHDLAAEMRTLEELLRGSAPQPAAAPAVPAAARPPAPAAPAPAVPAPEAERPATAVGEYVAARSSMVRVDFGRLDHLLNLVGELIIHRTKLEQSGRALAAEAGSRAAARDLLDAVQQVETVSADLQRTVMDVRMLPVRHVFERFPRMVRDLARAQGKEIELILEGEGTRVDKAVIDEIGEPLVHMLRNSIDHGIEAPAAREARGKNRTGTILLSAAQESSHVLITIMDDGGGIDPAAVRQKALQRGLVKAGDALSEREALQLIFAPGFSTAERVTEVSGRGVGLDVVIKSIERLNGLVEVESVPGVGTKFIIQLPLTLAIIAALLVEAEGRAYAVPLSAVVESLKLRPRDVSTISGRPTLRVRERIVPLLGLAELLGASGQEPARERYVVILGRGDKRVGLVVDRLRGQQEVVIKALDHGLIGGSVPVAGATIMGDGRVVLILDVTALFEGRRSGALSAALGGVTAGA